MDKKVMARYVKVTPRKVKVVADLIRKKKVDEALNILQFLPKAASPVLIRLIKSAVAAVGQHADIDPAALFIKEIRTDAGGQVRNARRFVPRAMGRASKIRVETSHLTLVVSDGKAAETAVKA
ncbi:50S ribosomal protein L22 [candidate division FCPU426 bacterium]|nr:50S ribosomal protein L22 [candidate division FCPU426 bacterium]